jgi:hypothetical protein
VLVHAQASFAQDVDPLSDKRHQYILSFMFLPTTLRIENEYVLRVLVANFFFEVSGALDLLTDIFAIP